jgi:hypothetical protein
MYFQPHGARREARGGLGALAAAAVCAVVVVLIGLRPQPAFTGAEQAGKSVAAAPPQTSAPQRSAPQIAAP